MYFDQFIYGRWETKIKSVPDESFDLGYTDPPYGMSYKSSIPGHKKWNHTGKTSSKFDGHILGDDGKSVDWSLLAREMFRVLKNNTYLFLHGNMEQVVIQYAHYFIDIGFTYKGTIAWNKRFSIGGDLKGAMKRSWEPILYFAKGKPTLNPILVKRKGKEVEKKRIEEIGGDWEFMLSDKEKAGFPTQKPVALARQIIRLAAKPCGVVFDPFAGSGTTALAARLEKRHYYVIEGDKKVYAKFKDRASEYEVPHHDVADIKGVHQ